MDEHADLELHFPHMICDTCEGLTGTDSSIVENLTKVNVCLSVMKVHCLGVS